MKNLNVCSKDMARNDVNAGLALEKPVLLSGRYDALRFTCRFV